MGPPTTVQRLKLVEAKLVDLEESVKGTVEKGIEAMRHSLTEVLMEGQGKAGRTCQPEYRVLRVPYQHNAKRAT